MAPYIPAEQALKEAVDGLKTVEEESIPVPGGIAYKAPKAGAYPKAAAVTADENVSILKLERVLLSFRQNLCLRAGLNGI